MSNGYQLAKIINKLYKVSEPFTRHKYSDTNWQYVKEHVASFGNIEGVEEVCLSAGEYHNYLPGQYPDINNPAYRQYELTIETLYGVIEGRLICHSAGTMEDPFSSYDMTCTFWKK